MQPSPRIGFLNPLDAQGHRHNQAKGREQGVEDGCHATCIAGGLFMVNQPVWFGISTNVTFLLISLPAPLKLYTTREIRTFLCYRHYWWIADRPLPGRDRCKRSFVHAAKQGA